MLDSREFFCYDVVMKNLMQTLNERGLVAQLTDSNMARRLETPQTIYCGFDPTADSLHVGSLIPMIVLIHARKHGHMVIPLIGGATAMIGDPSGKSESRKQLGTDIIEKNSDGIRIQLRDIIFKDDELIDFNGVPFRPAFILDNHDWFSRINWIDMLRDVGSKLSVNRMMGMDSVKSRLDSESGLSFLEFSYSVMQAFDFKWLAKHHNVSIQIGGTEQWGNITMGIELARKSDGLDLAGITLPLVTKSDGAKFGKSESGNIWLSADKTSVFDFWQFWRNVKDEDVNRFLKMFTFLPIEEINALTDINNAKIILAMEVTSLVHGFEQAQSAQLAAKALFMVGGSFEGIPSKPMPSDTSIINLLMESGFAASKTKANQMIEAEGVKVNAIKQTDRKAVIDGSKEVLLQFGKKAFKFTV